MAVNLTALTLAAALDVRQIGGQAIDDQQVSAMALLPKSTVQAGGDFQCLPGRGPLASMARNLGTHLRVIATCGRDEDDFFEGGSDFLRVTALSAARSAQYERHRLRLARCHASTNLDF